MIAVERAALEALLGRPLTEPEAGQLGEYIIDEDDRRDDLVAAFLSAGRTEVRQTRMSEAGLLERWPDGPVAADGFLAKLEAFAATQHAAAGVVRRALRFMATPEGLDLGAAATHAMLDMLQAGGVVTADEVSAAKELSRHAAPVSIEQVSRALNIAQGRMVL